MLKRKINLNVKVLHEEILRKQENMVGCWLNADSLSVLQRNKIQSAIDLYSAGYGNWNSLKSFVDNVTNGLI